MREGLDSLPLLLVCISPYILKHQPRNLGTSKATVVSAPNCLQKNGNPSISTRVNGSEILENI